MAALPRQRRTGGPLDGSAAQDKVSAVSEAFMHQHCCAACWHRHKLHDVLCWQMLPCTQHALLGQSARPTTPQRVIPGTLPAGPFSLLARCTQASSQPRRQRQWSSWRVQGSGTLSV